MAASPLKLRSRKLSVSGLSIADTPEYSEITHRAGCSKRSDVSPRPPWHAKTRLVPCKARAIYHFLKGGWNDPNCAFNKGRPATARCASTGVVPATPLFFRILLGLFYRFVTQLSVSLSIECHPGLTFGKITRDGEFSRVGWFGGLGHFR
jgi:hypothetical protein